MITLLSTNDNELTTEEVMDWLDHFDCDYQRINGEQLEKQTFSINLDGATNDLYLPKEDPHVIWYRRWSRYSHIDSLHESELEFNLLYHTLNHLKAEFTCLSKFYYDQLSSSNTVWVDHPESVRLTKLHILKEAKKLAIKIPDTLISNDRDAMIQFIRKHGRAITKTIGEITGLKDSEAAYVMGTKEVTEADLEQIPKRLLYPSLLQQLLPKKYDIRSFFLAGKLYSMAIFSQRREEASIDFRSYDFTDPDRCVPYQLPQKLERKLIQLAQNLGFQHCSFDLVKDELGEWYFIEINAVGQFGMVSKPCNYYLEYEVANYLKSLHDEKERV